MLLINKIVNKMTIFFFKNELIINLNFIFIFKFKKLSIFHNYQGIR